MKYEKILEYNKDLRIRKKIEKEKITKKIYEIQFESFVITETRARWAEASWPSQQAVSLRDICC